ncbi:MAG: hypothetical protein IH820_17200 [Bacteroidetes bacterium]|nr:hypothetical protein [Bacteroidota bacterium]
MAEKSERRLDTIRLFADLDPEVISDVERHCRWREYAVNETILDRDSQGGDVFFVVRGSVLIVNYSFTGREIALALARADADVVPASRTEQARHRRRGLESVGGRSYVLTP